MKFSPPLDKTVNLAFSCGKDSIACAHFLKGCHKQVKLIHVNNKLPGDDWIAVRAQAFARLFDFEIDIVEAKAEATEESCREARIEVFKRYPTIIVCHHLGDFVENYLYNVFSGKANYKPLRRISTYGATQVIRPFLKVRPEEIAEYLDKNKLNNYVVGDPLSRDSTRQWMREKLLPVIQSKFNLFAMCLNMQNKA